MRNTGYALLLLIVFATIPPLIEASTDPDLTIVDLDLLQVVENPRALIADKPFTVVVVVNSTFPETVYADINVTYNFGGDWYLEEGPAGSGVPIEYGINRVYIPGGRSVPGAMDPWIPPDTPPFLEYSRRGVDRGFEAEIDPSEDVPEADESNNLLTIPSLDVWESGRFSVLWVPLVLPGGFDFSISDAYMDPMYEFMLSVYPLSRENLVFAEAPCWRCPDAPEYESGSTRMDRDWLYEHVAQPISLYARSLGYDRAVICFQDYFGPAGTAIGMMREPLDETPVLIRLRASPGDMKETLVAHEIGHTLCLWHPHDFGPYVFTCKRYSSTAREYGENLPTFMSYRDTPQWVDAGRYYNDSKTWIPAGSYSFPGDPMGWARPYDQEIPVGLWQWNLMSKLASRMYMMDCLFVGGLIHEDGECSLDPSMYMMKARPYVPPQNPDQGEAQAYSVELLDGQRQAVASYPFSVSFMYAVHDDLDGEIEVRQTDSVPFVFNIPYVEDVRYLQVKDDKGLVVAEKAASSNSPSVDIESPLDGAVLSPGDVHTLQWASHDADDDPVKFIVSYSVDSGETWLPLAYDIDDHSLKWDTEGLEKDVEYLVRVTASDGFNTAKDDVRITLGADETPSDVSTQGGWGLHLILENNGKKDLENLDVTINIKGNLLRGDSFHQRIERLGPGEKCSVIHRNIFGFGKAEITLKIDDKVYTKSVFLVGPFIFGDTQNPLGFLEKLMQG
jgi:hypothetical protein